jgi:hypothetical protein
VFGPNTTAVTRTSMYILRAEYQAAVVTVLSTEYPLIGFCCCDKESKDYGGVVAIVSWYYCEYNFEEWAGEGGEGLFV